MIVSAKTLKLRKLLFPGFTLSLWLTLFFVSLNHLYSFSDTLNLDTSIIGVLGWITLLTTLLFLSRRFFVQFSLVFFLFFLLGFWRGPYLEPPVDPLEHLRRIHHFTCDQSADQVPRVNNGLWHYSMAGNFLCSDTNEVTPAQKLKIINFVHGLFWALLVSGLYILGRSVGLPTRWTLVSCIIAFLFFGTNRFSYFSYYSFAPSFTSLLIYWLWIAVFFFRKSKQAIISGSIAALLLLPILWVNHRQEAAFLLFVSCIWLLLNVTRFIWHFCDTSKKRELDARDKKHYQAFLIKSLYLSSVFGLLFIFPELEWFQNLLGNFFIQDTWAQNQRHVLGWNGIHFVGKLWNNRIQDTYTLYLIPILLLAPFFFHPRFIPLDRATKVKCYLLCTLPLIGYCVPLFHFVWASNVLPEQYWRLSYAAPFWLFYSLILFGLDEKIKTLRSVLKEKQKEGIFNVLVHKRRGLYYITCVILILLLSSIRSAPLYGKLDFLLLNPVPWWKEWQPMIEQLAAHGTPKIYSDPVTNSVMQGVFNFPTQSFRELRRSRFVDIQAIQKNCRNPLPSAIILFLLEKNWKTDGVGDKQSLAGSLQGSFPKSTDREKRDMSPDNFILQTADSCQCVINLHGFQPSWVSKETHHWKPDLAYTWKYYQYRGMRGKNLKEYLTKHEVNGCLIFR